MHFNRGTFHCGTLVIMLLINNTLQVQAAARPAGRRTGEDRMLACLHFFFQVQGQLIYTYCMTEKGGGERKKEGGREREREVWWGESNSLSFVYQTHNIKLHACICIS